MLFRIVYFYLCIAISPNTGYGFLISVIYLSAHHVYRQGPSMFTRKQPHGKNPHTFTNFEIMGIIHYSFIKKRPGRMTLLLLSRPIMDIRD